MDTALNRRSVEKREVNFLRLIHPSLDHREILIQPFSKKQGKRKGYRRSKAALCNHSESPAQVLPKR